MSEDCIFCRIVAGDIPSYTVYEDEHVLAFLDANPLAHGHTLVVPKDHYQLVQDLPAEVAGAMGEAVGVVAGAVEAAVDAEATTIAYNNGEGAGQEVPHVHAHVVPRFPDDGQLPIHALFEEQLDVPHDEMIAMAEDVAAEIDG